MTEKRVSKCYDLAVPMRPLEHARLHELAAWRGISTAQFVREALAWYLAALASASPSLSAGDGSPASLAEPSVGRLGKELRSDILAEDRAA